MAWTRAKYYLLKFFKILTNKYERKMRSVGRRLGILDSEHSKNSHSQILVRIYFFLDA